ncbi:CHASE2 domain-containing protein [Qipengyuania sp. DGS5-3]|uniref:CHASE2 domain-containing protein n=1 Tax=Qipengyuania sp. DGS5-3 TaxID=3349632 RepID=UPI0036D433A4
MTNVRLLGEWAILLIASVLLVLVSYHQEWTHRLDATVLDFATEQRLSQPSPDIVVVEIDDRSLQEVGNWPWNRVRHAELIDQLQSYDPASIIVDVLFIEPTSPEADAELARAIAEAGNVILPHSFAPEPGTASGTVPAFPLPQLTGAAQALGHVAVLPDRDGVVRRFERQMEVGGQSFPHLAVTAAERSGVDVSALSAAPDNPIAPMHASGAFPSISASELLSRSVPPEFLQGKTVLIGATAPGLGDRYSVPDHAGRILSGVEIQANFLNAIKQQQLVYPMAAWQAALIFLAALAALFLSFWRLTPRFGLYLALGLIGGLLAFSCGLLIFGGLWLPVVSAIFGIAIAYPLWGWRRLASVSRFLEHEAYSLDEVVKGRGDPSPASGFDPIAQQVSRVRGLIGATSERLTFLRQVLATSPDPMLVFDKEGVLALMNERGQAIFEDQSGDSTLSFQDLAEANEASYDGQKQELELKDGRVYLVARSPLDPEEGSEVIALRDITGLRASEQQRREMLEFLSHDMRSPQVAIIGLAGTLGHTLGEDERRARIEMQARRTLKLTDDFVQIARLEYEGIEREDTDIGALLHEASDRAYPLAKRKNIVMETRVPVDPEFCQIDASAFSRAIDNLVDNAIKFSSNGKTVSLALRRSADDFIQVEVGDEGPGLPDERMKDTFARFGAHDTRAGPSAGLGLAFVKKVVDEHGGEIEVFSTASDGTRFVMTIPCPASLAG